VKFNRCTEQTPRHRPPAAQPDHVTRQDPRGGIFLPACLPVEGGALLGGGLLIYLCPIPPSHVLPCSSTPPPQPSNQPESWLTGCRRSAIPRVCVVDLSAVCLSVCAGKQHEGPTDRVGGRGGQKEWEATPHSRLTPHDSLAHSHTHTHTHTHTRTHTYTHTQRAGSWMDGWSRRPPSSRHAATPPPRRHAAATPPRRRHAATPPHCATQPEASTTSPAAQHHPSFYITSPLYDHFTLHHSPPNVGYV
jgi:hypothetical protein